MSNKLTNIMPIEMGLAIATDNVKSFFKALNPNIHLNEIIEPTSGKSLESIIEDLAPVNITKALSSYNLNDQNNESNLIK